MAKRPYELLETNVQGLMRSHLAPFMGTPRIERIQIGTWKHQTVVRQVLNAAARSRKPPFAELDIGQDDWEGWSEQYERNGHRGRAESGYDQTKRAIIRTIRKHHQPDSADL
jgi:hypothetical protein